MPVNPDAVGEKGTPTKRSWKSKDALLYALGVGAGVDELAFTTENTKDTPQRVLPTMAVVIGMGGLPFDKIGSFNPAMLLHGAQKIEFFDEIPPEGEIETTGHDRRDLGQGQGRFGRSRLRLGRRGDRQAHDEGDDDRVPARRGNFGGERGPSPTFELPDRKPDHEVRYETRIDQPLLYRLSGDRNPLHSDPSFAKMGGFDRPILHGLCTYGFTGRALLHSICGSDPARFKSMEARFSKPVMPGDSLDVCDVGGRQAVPVPDEEPGRRRGRRPGRARLRVGRSRQTGRRGGHHESEVSSSAAIASAPAKRSSPAPVARRLDSMRSGWGRAIRLR